MVWLCYRIVTETISILGEECMANNRFDAYQNERLTNNRKLPKFEQCKGCIYADKTPKYGWEKAVCEKYEFLKPDNLLAGGDECEFREEE